MSDKTSFLKDAPASDPVNKLILPRCATSSELTADTSWLNRVQSDVTPANTSNTSPPNNIIDADFNKNSSRGRSVSESWHLWNTVCPILSPVSWFDAADSFSSFAELNPRHRSRTSASFESRRLVDEYDLSKSPHLAQHEQFKRHKWGEDQFENFDFDSEDIDIDLSLVDTIKVLPLTDTVVQCVKAYSKLFAVHPSSQPRRRRRSFNLQTIKELSNNNQSTDDNHSSDSEESTSKTSEFAPGELAVPRAVQEVLDFAVRVSKTAGWAFKSIMSPTCPKRNRHKGGAVSDHGSQEDGVTHSGDELQCGVDSLTPCPRRRARRLQKQKQNKSKKENPVTKDAK